MAFIASNGLTEAGTSKTIQAGGMTVHYHDAGAGEPVLFLHSYGPGTTAWITFHKTIGVLSQHFRCILMDLPNFSKTGPIVYREGVHAVQARTAVALRRDIYVGESTAEAEAVAGPIVSRGYRGFPPTAPVWGSVGDVIERFRAFGAMGYTDIIVRHLTNEKPKVLASLARLREVREALKDA